MSSQWIMTKRSQGVILWFLLCGGLYLTSLYSYILFHIVAESFSVVIAFSLFTIAWNTRHLTRNNYLLFISMAFLSAGFIDFVHILAYKGMGIFRGFDANLPTQLWIIARYLQSLSLLAAPWFIDRMLYPRAVFCFYLSVIILLLAAVFTGTLFPECFVEGRGLTPFKIFSEYVICLILLISLVLLLRRREKLDAKFLQLMVWSILFTIVSELAFTFYISVYGLSNLIGHYFKILSFYLVYKAIIVTGLEKPYSLLYYDLHQHHQELQIIIDASPIMIFYKDLKNRFIRVNDALARATGLPREEMEGKTASEIYPNHTASYWKDDNEVIASGKPKTDILEPIETITGTKWVKTDKMPYRDRDGNIVGIIGFSTDITALKQAETDLRTKEALLSTALKLAHLGHWEYDIASDVFTFNDHLYALFHTNVEQEGGYTMSAAQYAQRFVHPDDVSVVATETQKAVETADPHFSHELEHRIVFKDGGIGYISVRYFIVKNDQGHTVKTYGVNQDITERKQSEEKILRMAYYDSLTGLPNRKLFSDRLGIVLSQSQRNQIQAGIVMLDLDNFKGVNDTLGHDVGDLLLKAAAERLSATLRKGDTVARFGGDEFVLILPGLKVVEDATQVAQKIVERFRRPFLIDTHELVVTTSIGIAVYPNDGINEDILLKNADIAMYQAKQTGRDRYHFYKKA